MGFGLLFIGYMFMFSFPYRGLDILPDIIGFIISYIGIRSLSEYGCGFDDLKKYYSVLLPASFLTFVLQLLQVFGVGIGILEVWNYIYTAFIMLFNILLLVAIYKISNDTDLKSLMAKAKRNLIITFIYFGMTLILNLPFSFIVRFKTFLTTKYALGFAMFVFGYCWLILNLLLIYNCYMWICKPGDEDMPMPEKRSVLKHKEEED